MENFFFSKIDRATQKWLFKKGIGCAFLGFMPLIITALFCPIPFLEKWGILIFASGLSLLAYGMIPYQKMCYLKIHPHRLVLEKESFCFVDAKKGSFLFSYHDIEKIRLLKKKRGCFIKLYLKKKPFFFVLPFFSKECFEKLQAHLNSKAKESLDSGASQGNKPD